MPQESAHTQVFTVRTVLQVTRSLRRLFILSRRVAAEGVDDAVVARNARRRARTKQPKESK